MTRSAVALKLAVLLCPVLSIAAQAQSAITEQEAHAIAVDAYIWIIGRTKTDGPADYDAVHKIQAGYKITPLSEWGKPPKPVEAKIDPSVDMKTPPKIQVDIMTAGAYFTYAAELLKLQPPHLTDEPI